MRIKIGDKKIFSNSIKILLDVDVNIERLNAITFDSRTVEKGDGLIELREKTSENIDSLISVEMDGENVVFL